MKNLFYVAALLLIAFSFYACGECCSMKSINCMGYTDAVGRSWIPYTNKGSLVFSSLGGQRDTLTYDSVNVTAPYTTQKACTNNVCDANLLVTGKNGANSIYCFHQLAQSSNSGISNSNIVQISFLNCTISADSIAPTGLVNAKIGACLASTSFSSQLILNGNSFANVQEISVDSLSACAKSNTFRKIWLARGKGLIGYQTVIGNNVYVLQ